MKKIVTTSQCYECGLNMEGHVRDYRYLESGLDSVLLHNVLVFECAHCGAVVPQIVAATELHRYIATRLLTKKARLTGGEFRFLRKMAGYSATELAEQLATSKAVVSRWETKAAFGKEAEQLFRMLCVVRLTADVMNDIRPEDSHRTINMAVKLRQVAEDVMSGLKDRKTASKKKPMPLRIQIDPEDLAPWMVLPTVDMGCVVH